MIENIRDRDGELLAIIVPSTFHKPGVTFFTEREFSQQLGFMRRPKGEVIPPHTHNTVERTVYYTQEVIFIRKGRLHVNFYGQDNSYLCSHILDTGSAVLLIKGGHGFEVIEDVEMFEVKQGPYVGEHDKTLINNWNTVSFSSILNKDET